MDYGRYLSNSRDRGYDQLKRERARHRRSYSRSLSPERNTSRRKSGSRKRRAASDDKSGSESPDYSDSGWYNDGYKHGRRQRSHSRSPKYRRKSGDGGRGRNTGELGARSGDILDTPLASSLFQDLLKATGAMPLGQRVKRREESREQLQDTHRNRAHPDRHSISRSTSRSRHQRSPSLRGRNVSRKQQSLRKDGYREQEESRKRSRSHNERSDNRNRGRYKRRDRQQRYSRSGSGSSRSGGSYFTRSESESSSSSGSPSADNEYSRKLKILNKEHESRMHSRDSFGNGTESHRQRQLDKERRSAGYSSISSSSDRMVRSSPEITEQQFKEEMYRRLSSALVDSLDIKEREERIAQHIREMAKLSPTLFRGFMANNTENLAAIALMQNEPADSKKHRQDVLKEVAKKEKEATHLFPSVLASCEVERKEGLSHEGKEDGPVFSSGFDSFEDMEKCYERWRTIIFNKSSQPSQQKSKGTEGQTVPSTWRLTQPVSPHVHGITTHIGQDRNSHQTHATSEMSLANSCPSSSVHPTNLISLGANLAISTENAETGRFKRMRSSLRSPERWIKTAVVKKLASSKGRPEGTETKPAREHKKKSAPLKKPPAGKDNVSSKISSEPMLDNSMTKVAKQLLERHQKIAVLRVELEALKKIENDWLHKLRNSLDSHEDKVIVENRKSQKKIQQHMEQVRQGKDVAPTEQSSVMKCLSKRLGEEDHQHCCLQCHVVCRGMDEFFTHLSSLQHEQNSSSAQPSPPWQTQGMKKYVKANRNIYSIRGEEFMTALDAFYCFLCSELCADGKVAEAHLKSEEHHLKYQKYLSQHPSYKQRFTREWDSIIDTGKYHVPDHQQRKFQQSVSKESAVTSRSENKGGKEDKQGNRKDKKENRGEKEDTHSKDRDGSSRNRDDSRGLRTNSGQKRDRKSRERSKDRDSRRKDDEQKSTERSKNHDSDQKKDRTSRDRFRDWESCQKDDEQKSRERSREHGSHQKTDERQSRERSRDGDKQDSSRRGTDHDRCKDNDEQSSTSNKPKEESTDKVVTMSGRDLTGNDRNVGETPVSTKQKHQLSKKKMQKAVFVEKAETVTWRDEINRQMVVLLQNAEDGPDSKQQDHEEPSQGEATDMDKESNARQTQDQLDHTPQQEESFVAAEKTDTPIGDGGNDEFLAESADPGASPEYGEDSELTFSVASPVYGEDSEPVFPGASPKYGEDSEPIFPGASPKYGDYSEVISPGAFSKKGEDLEMTFLTSQGFQIVDMVSADDSKSALEAAHEDEDSTTLNPMADSVPCVPPLLEEYTELEGVSQTDMYCEQDTEPAETLPEGEQDSEPAEALLEGVGEPHEDQDDSIILSLEDNTEPGTSGKDDITGTAAPSLEGDHDSAQPELLGETSGLLEEKEILGESGGYLEKMTCEASETTGMEVEQSTDPSADEVAETMAEVREESPFPSSERLMEEDDQAVLSSEMPGMVVAPYREPVPEMESSQMSAACVVHEPSCETLPSSQELQKLTSQQAGGSVENSFIPALCQQDFDRSVFSSSSSGAGFIQGASAQELSPAVASKDRNQAQTDRIPPGQRGDLVQACPSSLSPTHGEGEAFSVLTCEEAADEEEAPVESLDLPSETGREEELVDIPSETGREAEPVEGNEYIQEEIDTAFNSGSAHATPEPEPVSEQQASPATSEPKTLRVSTPPSPLKKPAPPARRGRSRGRAAAQLSVSEELAQSLETSVTVTRQTRNQRLASSHQLRQAEESRETLEEDNPQLHVESSPLSVVVMESGNGSSMSTVSDVESSKEGDGSVIVADTEMALRCTLNSADTDSESVNNVDGVSVETASPKTRPVRQSRRLNVTPEEHLSPKRGRGGRRGQRGRGRGASRRSVGPQSASADCMEEDAD